MERDWTWGLGGSNEAEHMMGVGGLKAGWKKGKGLV